MAASPRGTFVALLCVVVASGCGPSAVAMCSAWANAPCPADYPNVSQGVAEDACVSNADFACGWENCDGEYDAAVACETDHPNCCNDVECDNGAAACATERMAWEDCVSRLRDQCEAAGS